ncbi:septal ring lytic transglycosylase RlpA family protein [Nocardiopsis sp. RSe5-2]|uniref:Probable endolytic peptidoglycan transglycosylase RlpA n=1 Tax=Nocardiopsis endophytica TaxID=3018445 RepID=A0ABT4UFT8_9ACTN|nr:septal ring lytic transglycosylase RlpA family protein [Nocardiopsis endophytica]MDA2815210.1 septal ring lytic transglycosylase RlpA family protein [Nocardiopsis endophytica]
MGSHQPDRVSVFQRLKGKRALVATAASGAVLAAGGVAGAAVVGGAQPQDLSSAAKVPAAQTSEQGAEAQQAPQVDEEQVDKERDQAREQREEAASQAEGAASATAAEQEKEQEPAQEDSSGGGSQDSSGSSEGLEPTGEGGACQASMYSDPQPTASGGTFDPSAMTAAHKSLPFGTQVEVTNPSNGKSVVVTINDRGPYVAGRCLDLSTASFETIASASQGVVDVEWQVVG